MARVDWREHMTVDPDLDHGDPCITGTRIPVATVVGSLADGMTPADIQAALAYAADVMRQELLFPMR